MSSFNYNHPLPEPPHSQPQPHSQADSTFPQYNTPFPPLEAQHPQQQRQPLHSARSQPPVQVDTQTPRPPPVALASPKQASRNKPRGFSFRSDKSHKSHQRGDSQNRVDLHETSAEKETRRIHSKADPTLAMNEAEPAVVARLASTNAFSQPLSSLQHRDVHGNAISAPDRSNPTRSRWERPLDTIKSFESAIDSAYNRKSIYKSDSESVANFSRRTSHYGNNGGSRFPHESYYGSRSSVMLDNSRQSVMSGGPRDGYFDGYQDPRNRMSRGPSDYTHQRPAGDRNGYPITSNHRSYETVASGSGGSASYGEPAGYQTDPTSSENSSINRRSPPKRQGPNNDYGVAAGQAPPVPASQATPRFAPPPDNVAVHTPQKATGGAAAGKLSKGDSTASNRPGMGEKRKSWFARRFSKNS